jgi:4-aminobutyrate aminotransferase-like enzyme
VIDVIEDEHVLHRTGTAGEALRAEVQKLAATYPSIGDVRGVGLANGIEIVRPGTLEPDAATAARIKNGLRRNGVLVGLCGRHRNVLKVRPPLAFTAQDVPRLAQALDLTLSEPALSKPAP